MNVTDPIADMLTRIRNALLAKKTSVSMPASNLKLALAATLRDEGYVGEVRREADGKQGLLHLDLRYRPDSRPVINGVKRVSKPGRRFYVTSKTIPRVLKGLGICVLSTPKGVMSGEAAAKQHLGGEVLCEVW